MALCNCQYIFPRCEYHHCSQRADWSVWQPRWPYEGEDLSKFDGRPGLFKFMCDKCCKVYKLAVSTPLKGITRPPNAPDDWRPSLLEHIRFAKIDMEHEDRLERERNLPKPPRTSRLTRNIRDRRL